jgi:hypothetical protein
MRKVLYYSMEHGALATDAKTAGMAEPIWYLEGGESQIILDTGCRTAVAGSAWHFSFQKRLAERNRRWHEVEHQEVFRFGAGEPVLSTKAYIYPVTPPGYGLKHRQRPPSRALPSVGWAK